MNTRPKVLVIDAGLGNIGSVVSAFRRLDCDVDRLIQPPDNRVISSYSHVVLPGVGSFSAGMNAISSYCWDSWIKEQWKPYERPLLGICLGMQLLASLGTEGGLPGSASRGLGLIPGSVERLRVSSDLPLPHVGWNDFSWRDDIGKSIFSDGIDRGGDMYFVHSYAFTPADSSHVLATSQYGEKFSCIVCKDFCFGVQFHPEKSQRLGHKLLSNFLKY